MIDRFCRSRDIRSWVPASSNWTGTRSGAGRGNVVEATLPAPTGAAREAPATGRLANIAVEKIHGTFITRALLSWFDARHYECLVGLWVPLPRRKPSAG